MSTRHTSIDALRERYQRSRLQQPATGSTDTTVPTTVIEEEEEEEEEEKEEDEENEEEEEVEDDDDYSMYSSSSSIPDENINFDLVYALHTFVATVDGQASVVKGDAMTLLDDTNSYWWLIRALKASEVGYIPAENIETPFERLARLNKHRNVQVTSLDQLQHYQTSPVKRTRIKKKVKVSKELACQLQIIITDQQDDSVYEEEFEQWDEKMSSLAYRSDEDDDDDVNEDSNISTTSSSSIKKKDTSSKYTPLLNPDFNKPINTTATTIDITSSSNDVVNKSLPILSSSPPPPSSSSSSSSPPIREVTQPTTEQQQQQPAQKVVTGLKRLLSIGSGNSKKQQNNKPEVDLGISSATLQQQQQQQIDDQQYHVLRIFSGNINVGAMFNTVAVTPDMNADQLLKLALQKFHIPLLQENNRRENGIEYYLTVKSMDSDEITLEPQDKPLAIFESLSDHLTTPMPSLTYIKRLSIEQPTIKVTRVGVSKARQRAKARFGEDSVIRFSLHKRIKRTIDTAAGQIYVKISFYAENRNQFTSSGGKISTMGLIRKSSLLRVDQQIQQQQQQLLMQKAKQERIDKLVAISTTTLISDLTITALEKFHMMNEDKSLYYMSLSLYGKETPLVATKTISDILGDSDLIPKGTVEKLFVLRKKTSASPPSPVIPTTSISESTTTTESTNRFVRYILKHQDSKETIAVTDDVSSTGNVLKRLDQAIQSLENDKRQLDKFQYNGSSPTPPLNRNHCSFENEPATTTTTTSRTIPVRSNSLSAMSNYRSNPKIAPIRAPAIATDKRFPPTRGSSLKISGDVFDSAMRSSVSNMDDLEMELRRIASSH